MTDPVASETPAPAEKTTKVKDRFGKTSDKDAARNFVNGEEPKSVPPMKISGGVTR